MDRGAYSPWGHTESGLTEGLTLSLFQVLNSVAISHLTKEEDEAQRGLASPQVAGCVGVLIYIESFSPPLFVFL